MTEQMRMWTEILFNCAYLISISILVGIMLSRLKNVKAGDKPMAKLFIAAFALLALGDLGHVGFRVVAYALDGLETTVSFLGREVGLVGLGALSTATTVGFFYALQLIVWQKRFNKPYGWLGIFLFVTGAVRLFIMAFPQNQWNNTVPPADWGLARNIPLMIQGLGLAYLIFRDSKEDNDKTFRQIGWCIIVSYAFYTPVILFVRAVPLLGMLMIPKTMAYVAIAWIGLKQLFPKQASSA